MSVLGQARSFHKKFKFIVEIDHFRYAGFQKCSELESEIAKVEHSEGGAVIPNKSPGRVSFSDITLSRGATQDKELYQWYEDVMRVASGVGLPDNEYKRNLDIVQQDRDGKTLRRWSLSGCWPVKFSPGGWDNESDENVIESMTLTYDFFSLVQ